jgi:class 3 adenylate cyclase
VGSAESVPNISVLGDTVNTAPRIASQAAAGELLFSDASRSAAGLPPGGLEASRLSLKGRTEPVDVCVKTLKAAPPEQP